MDRWRRVVMLAIPLLASGLLVSGQAPRGVATLTGDYGNSWALLIGVDQTPGKARLSSVADARRMRDALIKIGFPKDNIMLLPSPKGVEIRRAILKPFKDMGANDRYVVYFSGHGETRTLLNGMEEGYLLAADYNSNDLLNTAVSMREIRELGRQMPVKHVLFILDACNAGHAVTQDGGDVPSAPDALKQHLRAPVTEILAAGTADQNAYQINNQGIFTRWIVQSIEFFPTKRSGTALTASQLWVDVSKGVGDESNGQLTPPPPYRGGQGVFVLWFPPSEKDSSIALPPIQVDRRLEDERRKLDEEWQKFAEEKRKFEEEKRVLEARQAQLKNERSRPQVAAIPREPEPKLRLQRLPASRVIKIATQSPLSGGQAVLGEGIKLGTQFAIDKFRGNLESAGYKIELVAFDDQAKRDVGVANARIIIADPDILLVVGHLNSGVSIPSSEIYNTANLAMISPANTNPTVTDRGYDSVSRVVGRDDVQGIAAAEFARILRMSSAYVIHDKTQYGQSIAELFKADAEKKGIKVVGFEGTEEKSNFDPILTPIKAKNPDLIYFSGIYDQAAPFFKQARERGVKARFMGPDGMDSSDLAKLAGKAAVGTYYTSVTGPALIFPQGKQFAEEYRRKFGKSPEPYAVEAYDATHVALTAIERVAKAGQLGREEVSAAVRKVKLGGITGDIAFDGKGDRVKAQYFLVQVASDDPDRWGDNRLINRVDVAPPPLKR